MPRLNVPRRRWIAGRCCRWCDYRHLDDRGFHSRFLFRLALLSFAIVWACFITPLATPAADVDEAKLANYGPLGLLRWENIEGAPYWIDGVPLRFDAAAKLHVAKLAPGCDVLVHLPAGSLLRVVAIDSVLSPQDVRLWVSNGSGLYRRALSGVVDADGSLLLAPGELQTSFLRIERPADMRGCVNVALFISRRMVPDQAFPYPCKWVACASAVSLGRDGEFDGDYQFLPAGKSARLQVSAPARLRIESRLKYSPLESDASRIYQLDVRGDNLSSRVLQVHTRHERRRVMTVNGAVQSLGEKEVEYVDIPAHNHELVIQSSADTLLRITAAPCRTAYPAGWLGDDASMAGSIWKLDAQEVASQLAADDYPASRRWRIAQRVGRDNRYRDGGIQAWNILRQLAAQFPAHPDLSRWANKAKFSYTRLQPLLPVQMGQHVPLSDALFVIRPLPNPSTATYSPVVSTSLTDNALASMGAGRFFQIPAGGRASCQLPPGVLDTQIRLTMDRKLSPVSAEVSVQCDDSNPIRLRLYGHEVLPMRLQQPAIAESGLSALNRRYGPFDAGTLGGPFASRRQPNRRIEAATAELNVARHTDRVYVTNHADQAIRICLQYRVSRDVQLSESSFLACLNRQTDFSSTLFAVLKGTEPDHLVDSSAFEELRNHSVPFLRKLQLAHRSFASGVTQMSAIELSPSERNIDTSDDRKRALRLMQQRQWIGAMELWTRIVHSSTGSVRQEAILQRVDALTALGESYLAETELRGRILYDPDPAVRLAAQNRLADTYERDGDTQALQRLASAVLLADPSHEQIARLASASAQNGDWSTALIASLATPPNKRSAELLLQSAYRHEWWQLFAMTLLKLTDTEQQNYWHAIWMTRQGDFSTGTELLARAGDRGEALRRHIVRGHEIVKGLRHSGQEQRLLAVRQWEDWFESHPGPFRWQHDDSIITACSRVEQVTLEPLDDGYTMYRADVDQPAHLSVAGPVNLRFDVRPLHANDSIEPLNDWLVIRGSGREQVWPITRNRPADGLHLRSGKGQVPGRRVQTELHLGPGQHELVIAAESSAILVRVSRRVPVCSLSMLPPITTSTMSAVLQGRWGMMVQDSVSCRADENCPSAARIVVNDPAASAEIQTPFVRQMAVDRSAGEGVASIVDAWQRAQIGLRDGSLTAAEASRILEIAPSNHPALRADEILEFAARAGVPPSELPHVPHLQVGVDWQWMSVFHGRLRDALRIDPGSNKQTRQTQIALLVRLAEQQPAMRPECTVRLADLARQDPSDDFAARQLDRIKEPGTWVLFREVESSAGLYALPDGAQRRTIQPSNVRHALARAMDPQGTAADYMITGYRRLSLEVTEPRSVLLELAMRQPRISFVPAPKLEVEVQVDEQEPRLMLFSSLDKLQRLQIPLSAGSHRISVRITNPYAGHYVFINALEINSSGQRVSWQQAYPKKDSQRVYHVATETTPVQLHLTGPAWIRVERVVMDRHEIGETTVAAGNRQVTLSATPGTKRVLYRIWEYQFGEAPNEPPVFAAKSKQPPTTLRWLDQTGDPLLTDLGSMHSTVPASYNVQVDHPEFAGLAPADAPAMSLNIFDAFPLGGYEDGTWGFGTGVFKRRALEEGRQLSGEDRFVQMRMSYEQFSSRHGSYTKTDGLFRIRESSGPTFGLLHEFWSPVDQLVHRIARETACDDGEPRRADRLKTHTLLSAYFQQPGDPLPLKDAQTETSVGIRSRVYRRHSLTDDWYHMPSLTLIARWLSLDQISYLPNRVDQDVFTPFKTDHRVALYLTDTWVFEPSQVGRVWVRPALYTNEDLNVFRPDHVSLHTGITGLWHNLDWQFSYRAARFFHDEDRRSSSTQHLLFADAVLDHWRHAGSRYELSVNFQHEVDDSRTTTMLTLTRFLSRGRGYRDHHPSEVGFRSLRERRAYSGWQFSEPFGP